jgi:hypothetical protein
VQGGGLWDAKISYPAKLVDLLALIGKIPGMLVVVSTALRVLLSEFQSRSQLMLDNLALGLEEKLIAPRSPWQNSFAERLIGSIHRECLDHGIVLNAHHLNRLLADYFRYYHRYRPHRGLEQDCPDHRAVEPPEGGKIIAFPLVQGLHHRYARQTAA